MIAGLCESPLTFQAVTIWRNELNDGNVFLHDIIDLEATYAGPDAKAVPAAVPGGDAPSTGPRARRRSSGLCRRSLWLRRRRHRPPRRSSPSR